MAGLLLAGLPLAALACRSAANPRRDTRAGVAQGLPHAAAAGGAHAPDAVAGASVVDLGSNRLTLTGCRLSLAGRSEAERQLPWTEDCRFVETRDGLPQVVATQQGSTALVASSRPLPDSKWC